MRWESIAIVALLGAGTASAQSPPTAQGGDFAEVQAALRSALPGTAIRSVRPSPVPGLVEIVAGENLLYADPSGRWLVIGHLYDLETATDVTAERLAATSPRLAWADLPLEAAVRFGAGEQRLAVFTDPDCPWCRRLHTALRQASGVAVHAILYPLTAGDPGAWAKAVAIVCAADPPQALDRVMAGEPAPDAPSDADCATRARRTIERALAVGERLGVQGTPTLVAPDGRVHAGFLSRHALERWLAGAEEAAR